MPTLIFGTPGSDGADGVVGNDSPDLITPAGDGGDGTAGGNGGDVVLALTQEDLTSSSDFRIYGGYAGDGGNGAYSGAIFDDHHAVRTGDSEVQNDYFSAAGRGGNAGRGGDGGNTTLTASGLTFANGVILLSTSTNGGYGGAAGNGGAGATDIHNTVAAWQTYVDENLVQHTVSLDYTSHGAPGGSGGVGGDGGDAGNTVLTFSGNTVHNDVWLVAQGGYGGFGWQGGGGGAGNDPATGGIGGNGGRGGDANLTVDGNRFDFASSITFTAWGGTGGLGGVGGSGGYGDTAEGVEGVYDQSFTYAMGGVGGNGGDAGSGHAVITNNQFIGGDFGEILTLSIFLNSGARGDGGRGGVGALDAHAYDASAGTAGAYGASSLTFDGNVIDGQGGEDSLALLLWNMTGEVGDSPAGLTPLPALDINLTTGTMLVGSGVNVIDDIENVAVTYGNAYYDNGNNLQVFGDVTLTGNASNNQLTTAQGNDRLDGGAGSDLMTGGSGDDTYYVDNSGDVIKEVMGGGIDTVISSISYDLGFKTLENLTLSGSGTLYGKGNSLDNVITGNTSNNVLSGGAGSDTLDGGAGADELHGDSGNDTYYVDNLGDRVYEKNSSGADTGGIDIVHALVDFSLSLYVENLTLDGGVGINATGNGLDNTLVGNGGNNSLKGLSGNDTLDGGAGIDKLYGAAGNDTYYVDDRGDIVSEQSTGAGIDDGGLDTVNTSVSFTLGAFLENLNLIGTAAINGYGNSLDNVIHGNSADNTIDGKAGADAMYGGAGRDSYFVDNAGDSVSEQTVVGVDDGGIDKVLTTVSFTLGAFIENLTLLSGAGIINGTGNNLSNVILGNESSNVLTGGGGNDVLTGGSGNDIFVFSHFGAANGTDHLKDFVTGSDRLSFTASDFGFAPNHALQASELSTSGAAVGGNAQFVYAPTTHMLFWDSNGSLAGGLTSIAVFDNGATPSTADFLFT